MLNLPTLIYSRALIQSNTYTNSNYTEKEEPPIETVIDSTDVKDRVMEYLGAVLSRCWYDKNLMLHIEYNPHTALRSIGIFLPEDLDIKLERKVKERPRLVIYEWNAEHTFKKRICYLQMIMLAGR